MFLLSLSCIPTLHPNAFCSLSGRDTPEEPFQLNPASPAASGTINYKSEWAKGKFKCIKQGKYFVAFINVCWIFYISIVVNHRQLVSFGYRWTSVSYCEYRNPFRSILLQNHRCSFQITIKVILIQEIHVMYLGKK